MVAIAVAYDDDDDDDAAVEEAAGVGKERKVGTNRLVRIL